LSEGNNKVTELEKEVEQVKNRQDMFEKRQERLEEEIKVIKEQITQQRVDSAETKTMLKSLVEQNDRIEKSLLKTLNTSISNNQTNTVRLLDVVSKIVIVVLGLLGTAWGVKNLFL